MAILTAVVQVDINITDYVPVAQGTYKVTFVTQKWTPFVPVVAQLIKGYVIAWIAEHLNIDKDSLWIDEVHSDHCFVYIGPLLNLPLQRLNLQVE